VPKPPIEDAAVPKHQDGSTSLKCEGLSRILGRCLCNGPFAGLDRLT